MRKCVYRKQGNLPPIPQTNEHYADCDSTCTVHPFQRFARLIASSNSSIARYSYIIP